MCWLTQSSQGPCDLVILLTHVTEEEPRAGGVQSTNSNSDLSNAEADALVHLQARLPLSLLCSVQGQGQTSGSCPPSLPLGPPGSVSE